MTKIERLMAENVMNIESFQGEYRWLSNFWYYTVAYEGICYPTIENAYQAAKTDDSSKRLLFKNLTPGQAKRIGRQIII